MTILYTHPACLAHETPSGHPERVDRIKRLQVELSAPAFDALDRREAPMGSDGDILRAHTEDHLRSIRNSAPSGGLAQLDADTWMSPGTLEAALRAVGAAASAVDAVVAGEAKTAFCAMRPPGHHAEKSTAMGFCLFGTAAIGALRALEVHGMKRVALLDFDVHHGNGSQDILEDEARCFFASSHQMPLFPGTGAASETGAHGQQMNVPLPAGSGGGVFRDAWTRILERCEEFGPELIFVSAGFDAHRDDPLAQIDLTVEDFAWVTREIRGVAERTAGGRVVSTLEGGYDLDALAESAAAHVTELMEGEG